MTKTAAEQKKEARRFAKKWAKDVKEDGNTAPFWLSILGDVLGMEHPEDYISFEDAVKHEEKGSSLFVDAWMICTPPFTGQLVKGDFLCAIPMNSKNIALTCIGKDDIRKHLKASPKGGSHDGPQMVWKASLEE